MVLHDDTWARRIWLASVPAAALNVALNVVLMRFPLAAALDLEARVALPVVLFSTSTGLVLPLDPAATWPLQGPSALGVSFHLDSLWGG